MEPRFVWRLASLAVLVLVAVSGLVLAFHRSGSGVEGSPRAWWSEGSSEGSVVIGGSVRVSGDVEGYKQLLSIVESLASLTPGAGLGPRGVVAYPVLERADVISTTPTSAEFRADGEGAGSGVISGTNVQVEGVDEADIADTDGRVLVVGVGSAVVVYDLAQRSASSIIELGGAARVWGLLLRDDGVLVVIGEKPGPPRLLVPILVDGKGGRIELSVAGSPLTIVWALNVSDPYRPSLMWSLNVSGSPLAARLEGDTLIVIAGLWGVEPGVLPAFNGAPVDPGHVVAETTVLGSALGWTCMLVANASTGEWEGYAVASAADARIYYKAGDLILALSGLSKEAYARAVVEGLVSALASAGLHGEAGRLASIYQAEGASEAFREAGRILRDLSLRDPRMAEWVVSMWDAELGRRGVEAATEILAFRVEGLKLDLTGNVTLPGLLLDQFAVEEKDGYLVAALTEYEYRLHVKKYLAVERVPGWRTVTVIVETQGTVSMETERIPGGAAPVLGFATVADLVSIWRGPPLHSTVYTLNATTMEVAGVLSGIGKGMRIHAARLVGDTLYLVTFRRTDPLYAIDLSNPAMPTLLGALYMPGFSEYLHPVADGLLLGVGLETWTLKISLYNVSNPLEPIEESKVILKPAHSPALMDYHAFNYDPDLHVAYLPISPYTSGVAAVLAVHVDVESGELAVKKFIEAQGALRVFILEDSVVIAAGSYALILDRMTLEEMARIPAKDATP